MNPLEITMIGRIIASATHELNNVLGIVKDAGGLMGDVLRMGADLNAHKDKLQRAADKVPTQISRGTQITGNLNRFAHLMDQVRSEQDAGTLVQTACGLMSRLARQRKVTLTAEPPRKALAVETDATRLFLLLCFMLDACAEAAQPEQEVRLCAEKEKKELVFRAVLAQPLRITPGAELVEAAVSLGARLAPIEDARQGGLSLALDRS